MFLTIDGLDGSGKSAAAIGLLKWIRSMGRAAIIIEHPSDRLFGRTCRRLLLVEGIVTRLLATIFLSLDIFWTGIIVKSADDVDIIVVRYTLSVCYLPYKLPFIAYKIASFILPNPDFNIMIDTNPEIAMQRIYHRKGVIETFENIESMKRVRLNMLSINDNIIIINGNNNKDCVLQDIVHNIITQFNK